MKYLFDVGAHCGQDSLHIAKDDPNTTVVAFEPTPELASRLRWLAKEGGFSDRYKVYEQAISDYDGESSFHLVENDTGSASLNEFNDNLAQTWPGRTDFVVRKTIKVDVYRLESWLKIFMPEVTEIDHLHIDAQGSDLAVLKGLGSKISMVRSGVVEVPQAAALRLYKGQHTKEETFDFLEKNGFTVTNITSQVNEDNIFFERV